MTDRDQLSLTSRLLRDLGPEHGDGLRIGGVSAEEIAEQFGTPCYVYDAELLRRRCAEVTRSLGVDVLFAIKANPCLAVGQVLADAGAGADVASAGEVHVAMRAGFAKEKIQFAGPGKTRAELSLAVDRGVGTINLESASEYGPRSPHRAPRRRVPAWVALLPGDPGVRRRRLARQRARLVGLCQRSRDLARRQIGFVEPRRRLRRAVLRRRRGVRSRCCGRRTARVDGW